MLRAILALATILSFCGCASNPPALPHLASRGCAAVAQNRMSDARANGYSEADQIVVFRGSYADCVKWEEKGYEPKIP